MAEKKTTRKPLTEEEKAKRAENLRKAREAKKTKESVVEEQKVEEKKEMSEVELLKQEIELLKMQLAQQSAAPQVIQVSQVAAETEKVRFLWQAEVADDNLVLFGDGGMYGRIVGKKGSFYVPKSDLSRVMDGLNRLFLEKRWLIVLSGLNEEERETYGVNYKEGELLDRKMFDKMVDMGKDILDVYSDLCDGHKEIVAKRFYEAWRNGSKKIERETVVALNKMSPNSSFRTILEEMNARDVE